MICCGLGPGSGQTGAQLCGSKWASDRASKESNGLNNRLGGRPHLPLLWRDAGMAVLAASLLVEGVCHSEAGRAHCEWLFCALTNTRWAPADRIEPASAGRKGNIGADQRPAWRAAQPLCVWSQQHQQHNCHCHHHHYQHIARNTNNGLLNVFGDARSPEQPGRPGPSACATLTADTVRLVDAHKQL